MSDITVRRATAQDAPALAALMGDAFQTDPVSSWLFPDAEERRRLQPRFFGAFVDDVVAAGGAYTTDDLAGVTLWLTYEAGYHPDPAETEVMHKHMATVLGDGPASRFRTLDDTMARQHPTAEKHAYLPFIAIAPDRQGQGVGAALLGHRLSELDAQGLPAYLEASNTRNAKLYERLGFRHMTPTLDMPGGPSLHPMWRLAAG